MYTTTNYKTKKELKDAVAAGKRVEYFQPGPFGGDEPQNGTVVIEGPHSPQRHVWGARCQVRDGSIIKVIS